MPILPFLTLIQSFTAKYNIKRHLSAVKETNKEKIVNNIYYLTAQQNIITTNPGMINISWYNSSSNHLQIITTNVSWW